MRLKPSLTSSWSSAMRTRPGTFLVPGSISLPIVDLLPGGHQGDLRHHRRAGPRFTADLEGAAQHRDPLAHAGEPHPLAGPSRLLDLCGRKAASPVADLEAHGPFTRPQRDAHPVGLGVLAHVG